MESDDRTLAVALQRAMERGDLATVESLVGDRPGYPNFEARGLGFLLVGALYHAPPRLVEALLDAGADPNQPVDDGFPPLIAALTIAATAPGERGRSDTAELIALLIRHGADVAQRGINDWTALHVAAGYGLADEVELLLDAGADPNAITHIDDWETPAETAAAAGHHAIADRLRPLTPRLEWDEAVRTGDLAALRRMRLAGFDIEMGDGLHQTALLRAAHAGQVDVVGWLITEGADLERRGSHGLTALMLAALRDRPRVALMLVNAGARSDAVAIGRTAFSGKTAAQIAEDEGHRRLARQLREMTARREGR